MKPDNNPMHIQVMASTKPRQLQTLTLALDPGTTVQQALQQIATHADWQTAANSALAGEWTSALWGRKIGLAEVLRHGDRLELCRPLLVDPMVARRERFATQGARGAGLFSKRRAGAKAGY